jgi:hypothetical protein
MTVGIRAKMPGATQEQFEKVDRLIDLKGNPPKGLVFRAAGPIDGGWGVISFWESRQDFDTFQPRIAAAISGSGVDIQGPPDINEFPVHATFQP